MALKESAPEGAQGRVDEEASAGAGVAIAPAVDAPSDTGSAPLVDTAPVTAPADTGDGAPPEPEAPADTGVTTEPTPGPEAASVVQDGDGAPPAEDSVPVTDPPETAAPGAPPMIEAMTFDLSTLRVLIEDRVGELPFLSDGEPDLGLCTALTEDQVVGAVAKALDAAKSPELESYPTPGAMLDTRALAEELIAIANRAAKPYEPFEVRPGQAFSTTVVYLLDTMAAVLKEETEIDPVHGSVPCIMALRIFLEVISPGTDDAQLQDLAKKLADLSELLRNRVDEDFPFQFLPTTRSQLGHFFRPLLDMAEVGEPMTQVDALELMLLVEALKERFRKTREFVLSDIAFGTILEEIPGEAQQQAAMQQPATALLKGLGQPVPQDGFRVCLAHDPDDPRKPVVKIEPFDGVAAALTELFGGMMASLGDLEG